MSSKRPLIMLLICFITNYIAYWTMLSICYIANYIAKVDRLDNQIIQAKVIDMLCIWHECWPISKEKKWYHMTMLMFQILIMFDNLNVDASSFDNVCWSLLLKYAMTKCYMYVLNYRLLTIIVLANENLNAWLNVL